MADGPGFTEKARMAALPSVPERGVPTSILTLNTKSKHGVRPGPESTDLGEATSVQHLGKGGPCTATKTGLRGDRDRPRATHAARGPTRARGKGSSECWPVATASQQGDFASANIPSEMRGARSGTRRQCPAPGQLWLGDTR